MVAGSDLLLLCGSIRGAPADVLVYKATGGSVKGPSVSLIPDPYTFFTSRYNIAILAHRDLNDLHEKASDFYVASLNFDICDGLKQIRLSVFNSEHGVQRWRRMVVPLDCPYSHRTSKAIALGGGLLAFVDLWRGFIVCDLFGHRAPRYLRLPRKIVSTDRQIQEPDPMLYRDIALVQGRLTVVALSRIIDPDSGVIQSWEVSSWSRSVTEHWEENWQKEYTVQSQDIRVDGNTDNADLLVLRPDLGSLLTIHPTLSLSDTRTVYIMAKASILDKKALVLILDMATPRLQGVAVFNAERIVSYAYTQSRIPKYFNAAPEGRVWLRYAFRGAIQLFLYHPLRTSAWAVLLGAGVRENLKRPEKVTAGTSKGGEDLWK